MQVKKLPNCLNMPINTSDITKLRLQTGCGMMDCKNALEEAGGDASADSAQIMEKAVEILRKKGIAKAAKRADKVAAEGLVASYIHAGGRIGVLVEVNCETDFVAKTDQFKTLVNDIALHIAASNPKYLSRADVPVFELEKEKDIYREQLRVEAKPVEMLEKILGGKLNKYYSEACLLDQPFIKDESKTIEQLLNEKTAEMGEKISVRRFGRFELGEGIVREVSDFAAEVEAQLTH